MSAETPRLGATMNSADHVKQPLTPPRPLIVGLEAKHFAHPLDVSARRRIDRLVGRQSRIRKFFEYLERSSEDEQHLKNLADNTRLSPLQAPSLHRLVEQVAADARMPTPRVFLDTQSYVNAFAQGLHDPTIVLTSALVDQFTERQIRAVIGHELGHIRCQHTFYRSVAQGFAPVAALAATFPGGTLLALALQWHLLDWYRKSELSSDRFGLLVTGDLEAVQGVMVQFAGGSTSVREELSTDEFRRQANEFRDSVESRKHGSLRDRIEYYVSDLMLETTVSTHPWPAIRFVEIEDWANSPQYHHIARGDLDAAERHPFQYLPETVDEDDVDISEDGSPERGGPIAGGPVLRQAASEVVGAFKNWTAKPAPFGSHPQSRSSTSPPVTPANWYPDPNGTDQLRWWDGSTWTDKVRPS